VSVCLFENNREAIGHSREIGLIQRLLPFVEMIAQQGRMFLALPLQCLFPVIF
jgi:hypothetical protein